MDDDDISPDFGPAPFPQSQRMTVANQYDLADEPDSVLLRAERYRQTIDRAYIALGRELYLIFHRRLYMDWGYDQFDDWLERGFGMSIERGRRVKRIWATFIRRLHLRPEQLTGIGYTRALALLPVVDSGNVSYWLERARNSRWNDLKLEIEEAKAPSEATITAFEEAGAIVEVGSVDDDEVGSADDDVTDEDVVVAADVPSPASAPSPSTKPRIVERREKLTLNLYEDQSSVWKAARDEVQRSAPGEFAPNECLAHICTEFLAARATKDGTPAARLPFYLNVLERMFGGKFLWIKDEEAIDVLMGALEGRPNLNVEASSSRFNVREEDCERDHPDA